MRRPVLNRYPLSRAPRQQTLTLPLVFLLAVYLAFGASFIAGGCQASLETPPPTTQVPTARPSKATPGPGASSASHGTSTAVLSTDPLPSPLPTEPTETRRPEGTPSATPTRQPTLTPTRKPTPTPQPANQQLSWWYTPAGARFTDQPATISSDVRQVIKPYRVLWQKPVGATPRVYLTMDEGYEYETNTAEILDIAKSHTVKIVFFVTGSYIRNNPALVRRMAAEGHIVANHTDTHPDLTKTIAEGGYSAVRQELLAVETAYQDLTGQVMPRLMRPPGGVYSARVLDCLSAAGYRTVFWSFAYRDWETAKQPTAAVAKDKILGQLHDGSVILLHAVSDTNVAILADIIDSIRARGYTFALP